MTYGRAWERLNAAVLELATGTGTPRERLINAVTHDLRLICPERDFNDPETRAWHTRLMTRVCSLGEVGSDCPVRKTVARLFDSEVDEIVIDIVTMFDEVTRQEASRHSRAARRAA